MMIGDRQIGPTHPPYVIAEIGVNHDGKFDRAKELVAAAQTAGADAIKLQLFDPDRLLSKAAKLAAYQAAADETDPFEMLRRLELPLEQMSVIVDQTHELELHAIVSIFSVELVATAAQLPWDAFKSASPDLVNWPLLDAMQQTGRPLIVSTGAADRDEMAQSLKRYGSAALHCVSAYPTPPDCAQLRGIQAIQDVIDEVRPAGTTIPVGYSDHTAGFDTGALAVAAGASLLEKHLTYDRHATGPDHAASLEPDALAEYVRQAHAAWAMMGPGEVIVQEAEADVRRLSRQSLTTTRSLAQGDVLATTDITIKRPGTGISPRLLEAVIGCRVCRTVEADVPLTADDLEDPPDGTMEA